MRFPISKEELENEYLVNRLSMLDLAKKYGCCVEAIRKKLIKYHIQRRPLKTIVVEKTWLEQRYIQENLSLLQISDLVGCTPQAIYYQMKKNHTPTRPIETYHSDRLARKQKRLASLEQSKHNRQPRHHTEQTKALMRDRALGRTLSEETRKKISIAQKGNPLRCGSNHHFYGKHRPEMSGKNSPNWNGGITPLYKRIRETTKYIEWRSSCFRRDSYTCQFCGTHDNTMQVDHIKPFSIMIKEKDTSIEDIYKYKDLWNIDNGRTLCKNCHKNTDTYGRSVTRVRKKEK